MFIRVSLTAARSATHPHTYGLEQFKSEMSKRLLDLSNNRSLEIGLLKVELQHVMNMRLLN